VWNSLQWSTNPDDYLMKNAEYIFNASAWDIFVIFDLLFSWRGWDEMLLWVVKCARTKSCYNSGHLCDTGTLSQNFYRYWAKEKSVSNAHILAEIWIRHLRGCNILVPSDKINKVVSFLHTLFLFKKHIYFFSSFPYSWCCQMFVFALVNKAKLVYKLFLLY